MPLVSTTFGTLALLPFRGEAPLREKLEWKTEIQNARNGGENRLALRQAPRQGFGITIPAPSTAEMVAAFNLIYGKHGSPWAVPVWGEPQAYTAVAGSVINCDTTLRDLRAGGLALLWASNDVYALVEIASLTATAVTLTAPIPAALVGSAWIVPARRGRLLTPAGRSTKGYGAKLSLNWEVDDNVALTVAAPTQFLGNDIYFDESLIPGGGALEEDHLAELERIDDELGAVETIDMWSNNRLRRPHGVMLTTPAEVWAYRQWLHRRQGRYRPYWSPSFLQDVRPKATGTVTTTLRVWADDRPNVATNRTHIAVEDSSGNWYARTINSVATVDSTTLDFTLSSSLGIAATAIRRISYLGLRRLDTDRVELVWSNGVVTSAVSTLELSP